MQRARVVIGGNYGDEGKGLAVDYLCATEGAGVVVRFNGGAQAGHTVVTPDGLRHVFKHVGSGALAGVPTFLSKHFVCNPIMFFKEMDDLKTKLVEPPIVFADPQCKVTTFVDMIINQHKENVRGINRHGSVGLGVHETMQRSQVPSMCITMADLWDFKRDRLVAKLQEACAKWFMYRTKSKRALEKADDIIDLFLRGCEQFAAHVHPGGIGQCKTLDPVFEGAQGLLLDQDNKDAWPHVTHSKTGLANAKALCDQIGLTDIKVYYVSRTYLTRHGAGPLPNEDPELSYADSTNMAHEYQGVLRFAPLEVDKLWDRCMADFDSNTKTTGKFTSRLVFTHCDQLPPSSRLKADLYSYGPTRNDIRTLPR